VPVVSSVGTAADADTRQGYDSGARFTPEEQAEYQRRQEARQPQHANDVKREAAEHQRAAEEAQRAAHPDPRQELRLAHQHRAEAQAELGRITELRDRASSLVASLTAREVDAVTALRARNAAAAEALVAALSGGADALAHPPESGPAVALIEAIRAQVAIAREAQARLESQASAAARSLDLAEIEVKRAAMLVGSAYAAAEAAEIERLAAALWARQAGLWSLSAALTHAGRAIGPGVVPPLTASVHRAIGAAVDSRVDSVWGARLQRLHEDPEFELG
jgi:hypothetical protein